MDHETVLQQGMTERYLLDELSEEEQDRFEEHYFGCSECAEDVRSGMLFVANASQTFRKEREAELRAAEARRETKPVWWDFLRRPAWGVLGAAAAALVFLLFGFVTGVLPLRRQPELLSAVQVPWEIRVRPLARAPESVVKVASEHRVVLLRFVLPPEPYPAYSYELAQEKGKLKLTGTLLVQSESQDELRVSIQTSSLAAGRYRVSLNGLRDGKTTELAEQVIEIEPK